MTRPDTPTGYAGITANNPLGALTLEHTSPPAGAPIVCISGSMRFADDMARVAGQLSFDGCIVVMPHVNGKVRPLTAAQKAALDRLHLAKIDLADEVLVVTRDGYIGDSTRAEIEYAQRAGKPVRLADVSPTVLGAGR